MIDTAPADGTDDPTMQSALKSAPTQSRTIKTPSDHTALRVIPALDDGLRASRGLPIIRNRQPPRHGGIPATCRRAEGGGDTTLSCGKTKCRSTHALRTGVAQAAS